MTFSYGFSGITLSPFALADLMTSLTWSPHPHMISFREFRDFLLLLPRRASTAEIYQYYEVKKFMGDDGRGAARVTMEGSPIYPPPILASVNILRPIR